MITREEALQKLDSLSDMPCIAFDIVREIFNDHEAIIKAKDEEIEKLKVKYYKCLDDYISKC